MRATPRLFALVLSCGALACAGQAPPPPSTPELAEVPEPAPSMRVADLGPPIFSDPERRAKLERGFVPVDEAIAEKVELDKIPGLALGIVIDGELAHFGSFGFADVEGQRPITAATAFRIGSITKVFTALRILQLRDAGEFELDDPVFEAVPALAGLVYPSADARPITYADLLTHSSGLPRLGYPSYWETEQGPTSEELAASLEGFALTRAPGTGYAYSNLGFGLLGLVLRERGGHGSARATITRSLLEPLAMADTRWDPADYEPSQLAEGQALGELGELEPNPDWVLGAMESAGGLYSTVDDLARFLAWQLDAWPPRSGPDDPILARASSREAQTIHFAHGGDALGAKGVGWGWHGGKRCEGRLVAHSGRTGGFAANVALMPDHGVAVILLTNSDRAKTVELTHRVIELLGETGGLRPRRAPVDPLADEVSARLVAALGHFDDSVYDELAAPILRKEHELEHMRADWSWWSERLGACTLGEVVGVRAPNYVDYALACAAGRAKLRVHVQVGQPQPLLGYRLSSRAVEPDPAVVEAANRAIALLDQWNDHGFELSFAPRWSTRGIEDFFGRTRERYGACSLGKLRMVRARLEAEFELDCENEAARMKVRVTEYGDGKIDGLTIRPAKQSGPC